MKIRDRKGYALMFVLVFFLTATLGLTSLGQVGGSHLHRAKYGVESMQAFYLAQAAVEEAKAILKNEDSFFDGTPMGQSGTFNQGAGEFVYDIQNTADGNIFRRVVTGVASVPDRNNPTAERAVEVIV